METSGVNISPAAFSESPLKHGSPFSTRSATPPVTKTIVKQYFHGSQGDFRSEHQPLRFFRKSPKPREPLLHKVSDPSSNKNNS